VELPLLGLWLFHGLSEFYEEQAEGYFLYDFEVRATIVGLQSYEHCPIILYYLAAMKLKHVGDGSDNLF
jgi:hypothetical protein